MYLQIIPLLCSPQPGIIIGKLLGVDGEELYKNLCKPKIKVGAEFVTQGRNVEQVLYSCGALAKGLFDRCFKWLVKMCNITLETGQKRAMFIGVLDIAGFEIFDVSGIPVLIFTKNCKANYIQGHVFIYQHFISTVQRLRADLYQLL